MAALTWLLTILAVALVALLFHLRRFRGKIEDTGLPIVKPFLCFGSPPYLLNKIRMEKWYQEKFQQYGKTFARYEGATPQICTIDPEIVKEVTVKQFENFTDIVDMDFKPEQTTLDVSRGETWKALRKLLSPTFTTGKLKGMLDPIEGIADRTIDFIAEESKNKSEIDMKGIIQGFAFDSISKVAFGIDTNAATGQNQEFFNIAKDVFEQFSFDSWGNLFFWSIFIHFPEIAKKMGFWNESAHKIRRMTHDIMVERDKQNIQVGDFIDRLREFKKVAEPPITEAMIEAQGMIFLVAGYETTANTMGSMMYLLSKNQDAQENAIQEILEKIGSEEITHENINHLDYLEACITETLRMCPPVNANFRTCTKDCVVKGIRIRKGVQVLTPYYASHYDPEFFPEPEKFRPERFLKENADQIIPYTWRPFGSGNRVCIGQRFAIMEMKIFIAKLLAKFKIDATPKTELKYSPGGGFLITYPNIYVKLEPRN